MKTNKLIRRVHLAASVASIITCIVVTGFALLVVADLIRNGSGPQTAPRADRRPPLTAESLASLDLDWKASDRTLLLALHKGCGYCRDSAPFYRRLAQTVAAGASAKLVAVLPHELGVSREYLSGADIPVAEVRQAELGTLGIRGTPTLVLVNREGMVTDTWVGKLSSAQESEVLERLRPSTATVR